MHDKTNGAKKIHGATGHFEHHNPPNMWWAEKWIYIFFNRVTFLTDAVDSNVNIPTFCVLDAVLKPKHIKYADFM